MIESASTYLVTLPWCSWERNLGVNMRNLTPYGSKIGGFRRSPVMHTYIYSTYCLVLMSYPSICCKYQGSFDHDPSPLALVERFCLVARKLHLVPCHRRIRYVLLSRDGHCTFGNHPSPITCSIEVMKKELSAKIEKLNYKGARHM